LYLTFTRDQTPQPSIPSSEFPSTEDDWPWRTIGLKTPIHPKSGEQGPQWGGLSPSYLAVKRRYVHRDCRQKPDAFSPVAHSRSWLPKSIVRVKIRRGILWPGKSLGRSDPDFKLLDYCYDTVTSIKRKQLSFVAGCIEADFRRIIGADFW